MGQHIKNYFSDRRSCGHGRTRMDLGTACLHHAAGSADRHAWNGSVCGARAGCAAVSSTGAAATYLDPELALEDLLGVPPAEPGFPPFAAAERRRGDVRWLI